MSAGTLTMTEEVVETRTSDDPGDSAHIVWVPPGSSMTAQALVMHARVEGVPVTALCGHTWVPVRDPLPLPVCSRCLELYHAPGENRDDRDELPAP